MTHTCEKHRPGTPACYSHCGCRCDHCRTAMTTYKASLRPRPERAPKPPKPVRVWHTVCTIPGCDKPVRGRGWCITHYNRWHRHGDPTVADVRLTRKAAKAAPAVKLQKPAKPSPPRHADQIRGRDLARLITAASDRNIPLHQLTKLAGWRTPQRMLHHLARAGRADLARQLLATQNQPARKDAA